MLHKLGPNLKNVTSTLTAYNMNLGKNKDWQSRILTILVVLSPRCWVLWIISAQSELKSA